MANRRNPKPWKRPGRQLTTLVSEKNNIAEGKEQMKKLTTFTLIVLLLATLVHAALPLDDWQSLTAVGGGTQSRLQPSHWPHDKYPDLPEITPRSNTVVLDADRAGGGDPVSCQQIRRGRPWRADSSVFGYDGESKPSIEMPYMDFLGDPDAKTARFRQPCIFHM